MPYETPTKQFCGILFTAEAPGQQEEEQRKPLVGSAGKLYNKWLALAGIQRRSVYTTNAFRYRPDRNKVDNFFVGARAIEEQGAEADIKFPRFKSRYIRRHFCSEIEHLHETIVKVKPNIVVTMGAVASWALTGDDAITAIEGTIIKMSLTNKLGQSHRFMVIPCFHPAAVLYDPSKEEKILRVFKMAKRYKQHIIK